MASAMVRARAKASPSVAYKPGQVRSWMSRWPSDAAVIATKLPQYLPSANCRVAHTTLACSVLYAYDDPILYVSPLKFLVAHIKD